MDIYLISGLGADRTIFRNLTFSDATNIHYLDWITPNANESLKSYALRMAETINQSVPFALVGLSFGGMLATEIANVLHPQLHGVGFKCITNRNCPGIFALWAERD